MESVLNKIKIILPKKLLQKIRPGYHFSMSFLAALWYRFPSRKLIVIGVTGTTGKTTTVWILAKVLQELGWKVGYTSTAMFGDGNSECLNDKKMTMVGRFFTQKMLSKMAANGCRAAIVETTSEGVVQFRHRFIDYDILVFTGLYPEHIESHGSFENYRAAKGKLFAHLAKCDYKYLDQKKKIQTHVSGFQKVQLERLPKTIIANGEDQNVEHFLNFKSDRKVVYGVNDFQLSAPDLKKNIAEDVSMSANGLNLKINNEKIATNFLGFFNAGNILAAWSVAQSLGFTFEELKNAFSKITPPPGRLEKISVGQNFTVLVDYAFEPGAVTKLYETLQVLPHKQIIHVLGGTGGGRDASRRPILGQIAGRFASYVIITDEDPYDDDPLSIMEAVADGAEGVGKILNRNLFIIPDRREAIRRALLMATQDDIVLITGKGCEQHICVAQGKKIPWDDRTVVREELGKISK